MIKRKVPRPFKARVKMVMAGVGLKVLSLAPGAVVLSLFGVMVMMFIMTLADLSCLYVQGTLAVAP